MAVRRYTQEDLVRLRESPLVQKPEQLPAIEQWIEYVYADHDSREKLRIPHSESQQQQQAQNAATSRRQPQSKSVVGEASPMGSFGAGARPSLMPTRSHASRSGEDISLGPPRTMFPSSRNVSKLSDFTAASPAEGTPSDDQEAARDRVFGGDRPDRKHVGEKTGRDSRESWTSARDRRAQGVDDEHKPESRFSKRDRDQDGERRNEHGEKTDSRWGDRRQNGDKQGGWRERERDKKDHDWVRGGRTEREPEWMEDPAPPGAEDDLRTMGMPRNQEQFQRWKEAMSGKRSQTEPLDTTIDDSTAPTTEPPPIKQTAPLKLEGIVDKPFRGWAENKPSINTPDGAPTPAKSAPGKTRGSRFASMFKDSQPKEETLLPESNVQRAANVVASGVAEDAAGFKRILEMLGGTGMDQPSPSALEGPSSPAQRTTTNGTRQKSRFTGFFDQTPKSPDRIHPTEAGIKSPEPDMIRGNRSLAEEPSNMFGGRLPESRANAQPPMVQLPSNPMSSEAMLSTNGSRDYQQPGGRMNDLVDQQRSRGTATPDLNIQNLLASQRAQRPQQGQDKNSEFLLNLLQTKASRPASQQQRPDDNFSLWLDQPPTMPEPHAPKPRAPPPPGLFEDHLLRNAPPELSRQEQLPMQSHELPPQRRTSQRAPPPGFYDEQSLFLQQQQQAAQRRNFTEPPQHHQHQLDRRMSGHPNLPQMQIPPSHMQQFVGAPQENFIQSPTAGLGPPPGFNPHMPRHPPGYNSIPNIFQQPQTQPQRQQGREPLGYATDRMPYVGGANSVTSPPVGQPSFYGGPPGMGPPGFMGQMRSPNEGVPVGARGRGYDSPYEGIGRR